ncbi:hypothetical protein BDV98DRAFT_576245 [Pterulicium gracile]|uniref:Uncharacterized protein n=1 Tax=Pterulicium gracile TaxID=1884261 RepID=A0A5C3Q2V1_9AGAR|nr:hypothetical protein BDV98DRAFT_576245 [Pterula gracilis]
MQAYNHGHSITSLTIPPTLFSSWCTSAGEDIVQFYASLPSLGRLCILDDKEGGHGKPRGQKEWAITILALQSLTWSNAPGALCPHQRDIEINWRQCPLDLAFMPWTALRDMIVSRADFLRGDGRWKVCVGPFVCWEPRWTSLHVDPVKIPTSDEELLAGSAEVETDASRWLLAEKEEGRLELCVPEYRQRKVVVDDVGEEL